MSNLVDVTVAMVWFGLFSLWSFYSKLYTYGHNLEPDAPVKVAPFTPPMLGSKQLANFTVFNYPATGSYLILLALLLLVAGIFLSSRQRQTKL
jgi:copper chaperone NosL